MSELRGKVAIVTGAGRGIGRAEAEFLARHGARVVVNDVDAEQAHAVVDAITADGGTATANVGSVADWNQAGRLCEETIEAHGPIDMLVNNAGIIRDSMSFSMSEEDWDDVVTVHLTGHAAMAHHVGHHWRARSKELGEPVTGRIINTASESGLYGLAGQMNYAAAKAGIASMTIVLARELAKYGVTVNAIAPRARTRMTETALSGLDPEPGTFDEWSPANIAPLVGWLAADAQAEVTGQLFVICGDVIHLMSGWHRVGRVDNDGAAWTLDALDATADELFGEQSTGLPPMGFGE